MPDAAVEAGAAAPDTVALDTGGLPRLTLPDDGPGEDRFWAWRDTVASLWDVAVDSVDEARRFQASLEVFHIGTGIVARSSASRHQIRRTSTIVARMGVDHILLQVRCRGTQIGEAADRRVEAAPGDVCILDTARTYSASSTEYEAVTLILPRGLFLPLLRSAEPPHGLVLRGNTPVGRLLGDHIVALAEAAPTLSVAEAEAVGAGTAALTAACCGPAMTSQVRQPTSAPGMLLAIRRHIEVHLGAEDLAAESIAQQFGLSRSALYRLFEPFEGVADYIRKRRLARAYAELGGATTVPGRRRISDVSRDCGFESGAVFSRAFRREFGFSPREMQFAAGQPVPPRGAGTPAAALHEWLVRLAR